MKAVFNGNVIAESDDIVVVEGNNYFPKEAVNQDYLQDSDQTSFCPWKGTANYYSLDVNGEQKANAVWYYAEPSAAAKEIKDRVAFGADVEIVS